MGQPPTWTSAQGSGLGGHARPLFYYKGSFLPSRPKDKRGLGQPNRTNREVTPELLPQQVNQNSKIPGVSEKFKRVQTKTSRNKVLYYNQ